MPWVQRPIENVVFICGAIFLGGATTVAPASPQALAFAPSPGAGGGVCASAGIGGWRRRRFRCCHLPQQMRVLSLGARRRRVVDPAPEQDSLCLSSGTRWRAVTRRSPFSFRSNVAYAGFVLCALALCNAGVSPYTDTLAAWLHLGGYSIIGLAPSVLVLSAALASVSAMIQMPYCLHVVFVCISYGLWGVAGAMAIVPAPDFMASVAGVRSLAGVVALMLTALNLGIVLGSCLGTLCAQQFGFAALFAFIALASAVSALQWHLLASDKAMTITRQNVFIPCHIYRCCCLSSSFGGPTCALVITYIIPVFFFT